MTGTTGYELLDAGDGRRLERFGVVVVDRPAPGAVEPRRDPAAWPTARARFDVTWSFTDVPDPWLIEVDGLTLELRPTDAGQVGYFPEQSIHWPWLRAAATGTRNVLHLFAYTGATTLVLAGAGASVAHVDASRSGVAWARRNADRSDLGDRPVRWLVDDASAFVAREGRREHRYGGIVLDPPSYGHGPSGRDWRIGRDLDPLLAGCAAIADTGAFVLLTAHTPDHAADELASRLAEALGKTPSKVDRGEMTLAAASGAVLTLGSFARIMGR